MNTTLALVQPRLERRYTKVPTELLAGEHPVWETPAVARLLLRLLAFGHCRPFHSKSHLAAVLGTDPRFLRRALNQLQELGLVSCADGELRILDPGAASEEPAPREEAANALPAPEEASIAQEVGQEAKRKSTGLTQADRWEGIKAAWNANKPENFMLLDGRLNLPLLIAIETQTKRLKVDRDDYDAFIGAVLRGAAADPWWAEKNMKASQVFGFGADLPDTKFTNVEKLYLAGRGSQAKATKGKIDWSDDAEVLARATSYPWKHVVRVHAETLEAAQAIHYWSYNYRIFLTGYMAEDDILIRQQAMVLDSLNISRVAGWADPDSITLVYVRGCDTPKFVNDDGLSYLV